MKKLLLVAFASLCLLSVRVQAESNNGILGTYGGEKVWRTTTTASNDFNSKVACGSIVIGGISIGVPGTSSTLELFDGYSSSQTSTKRIHKTDTTSKVNPNDFAINHSSGLIINNLGSPPAEITIFYDWIDIDSRCN